MKNQVSDKAVRHPAQPPLVTVGEPLDGRHFLDVIEEQQYSGKPFVPPAQAAVTDKEGAGKQSQES